MLGDYMLTFLLAFEEERIRSKLEEIYLCYHKELFILAYEILKDYQEAEDVIHNAIIKLSNNLEKISDIKCKKTRSYLIIIVRNLSYDAYNNKKRITSIPFDEINQLPIKDEINLDEHMLKIEKTKEIAEKLNMVHPPYADIITLRYYNELSISETSKLLNITENNASVRINRAIKALKRIIGEGGELIERST